MLLATGLHVQAKRLARVLIAQEQYAEAETLLLRARAIRGQALGPTAKPTQDVVESMVKLYDAWGKPKSRRLFALNRFSPQISRAG